MIFCHQLYYLQKNGTWYRGSIEHMGNKYNSWSKNEVVNYLCH